MKTNYFPVFALFTGRNQEQLSRRMARIPLAFAILSRVLFLVVPLLAASCDSAKDVPAGPRVLQWSEAGQGDVVRIIVAQGIVRARGEGFVKVGSRLKGQILEMYVRTGDVVHAGQLLAVVDDRELQDQKSQAVAKLEAARNEYDRLVQEKDKRLEEARAGLAADEGRLGYATRLLERHQALRDRGYVAQNDLDASRRDDQAAVQTVASDQAVLDRVAKENEDGLKSARQGVAEAQAMVDQADAFIAMTRVVSPIDGIVGEVNTMQGEQVVAELEAVKILTIIDPRYLELWIYVNEADAAGVRPGLMVRFFKSSRPDEVMGAVVERVSPTPEEKDKVLYYPAIASLPPQAALYLRPEMNVQCFVKVEELKNVLSVPNEAIVSRGGVRRVYVEDGRGGARAVAPVFGTRGTKRTQVLSGLELGTRVAVKFASGEARAAGEGK
jgi:multidrug efflux pump subunit AcrA (membrane-fusion protein)